MRYLAEEKRERAPQKPFPSVTMSARRKFLCSPTASRISVARQQRDGDTQMAATGSPAHHPWSEAHLTRLKCLSSCTNSRSLIASIAFSFCPFWLFVKSPSFTAASFWASSSVADSLLLARAFATAAGGLSMGVAALEDACAGEPVTGGTVKSAAVPAREGRAGRDEHAR